MDIVLDLSRLGLLSTSSGVLTFQGKIFYILEISFLVVLKTFSEVSVTYLLFLFLCLSPIRIVKMGTQDPNINNMSQSKREKS